MLADMGALHTLPSIFETDEELEAALQREDVLNPVDFKTILEQKLILQRYMHEYGKIEKKRHRDYWETIKRVHAKLDMKIEQ